MTEIFVKSDQIRMHDTDAAGHLFFGALFRIAHDALEDFAASEGFSLGKLLEKKELFFVIVHAAADYVAPLRLGDKVEVQITVSKVGQRSFSVDYRFLKGGEEAARAKTVHVAINPSSWKPCPLPEWLITPFARYTKESK